MRPNENSNPSESTYHKKDANKDTSEYDRVLNALKKLDTSYTTTMQRIHEPFTKGKYKVTGETKFNQISVEHKKYEIQWAYSTSMSTDA